MFLSLQHGVILAQTKDCWCPRGQQELQGWALCLTGLSSLHPFFCCCPSTPKLPLNRAVGCYQGFLHNGNLVYMKLSWLCFKQDWKWLQQGLHPWLVLSGKKSCQGQGIAWWDYANSSSQEVRNSHLWPVLGDRRTQCHCGLVVPSESWDHFFLKTLLTVCSCMLIWWVPW